MNNIITTVAENKGVQVIVKCPNKHCGRVISRYLDLSEVRNTVNCDVCEALEEDVHSFAVRKMAAIIEKKIIYVG